MSAPVSAAIAGALAGGGVDTAFGLAGSGNFHLINAMRASDIDYVASCHEGGAVSMADGYARASGRVGVATVHQGPGMTNTLTALTEATKSGTPLVLLAPEAPADGAHANQALDTQALAEAIGASHARLEDPASAAACASDALGAAVMERRPVVLTLPVDQLGELVADEEPARPSTSPSRESAPSPSDLKLLADELASARRPLVVAGRGAVLGGAGPALRELAERSGALLATTIVAKGLFAGDAFSVGFIGGLASPLATEIAGESDLVLGFGTKLDHWTTCGGRVPGPGARIGLIDDDPEALASVPEGTLAVLGDAAATADALTARAEGGRGWRTPEIGARIAAFDRAAGHRSTDATLDPHALTIAINGILPRDRIVAPDSGHFLAFPAMYMDSPDGRAFLFAQGFQAVGLGLGVAIGAAVAHPRRTVAAMIGDGGAKMSLLELDTAARRGLSLAVVVYDDGGYGAEIHDFEPLGVPVDIARFPSRDYASIARALGAEAVTIRSLEDLEPLERWVETGEGPLLLDCKVDPSVDVADSLTEQGAAEWSMASPVAAG